VIELVKAKLDDIPAMQALVAEKVKDGTILERSEDEINSPRLAEIRSLIVAEEYRGQHIGQRMVRFTLEEAKELGVKEDVLVLTYLPAFFEKLGFKEINKEVIPEHKIWADCIKCIHFPVCNEVALVYKV